MWTCGRQRKTGSSGNFVADRRHSTTDVDSVKERPQPSVFAGQRSAHLPSPGQRPGFRGDDLPRGPTVRPFATNNETVTPCHTKWTKPRETRNNITRRGHTRANTGDSALNTESTLTDDMFGIELLRKRPGRWPSRAFGYTGTQPAGLG